MPLPRPRKRHLRPDGHSVALPAGQRQARAGEGFHRRALYRRGYRPERVGRPVPGARPVISALSAGSLRRTFPRSLSAVLLCRPSLPSLSVTSSLCRFRSALSSLPRSSLCCFFFCCPSSAVPASFRARAHWHPAISVAYRPIKKDNRDFIRILCLIVTFALHKQKN